MNDNECFRWCLAKYLNPANKNPVKIRNADEEFPKQFIKFPVYKKTILS